MLSGTWAKRENANPELSRSSTLESGLATGREKSTLKKRDGLSRRSKAHQREAPVLSKGPPGRATPEDWVGLSSMGEALSVKQDRKLSGEVEGT